MGSSPSLPGDAPPVAPSSITSSVSPAKRRPTGLTVLATLWSLSALVNLYYGFTVAISDAGFLPSLSNANLNPWFRFGLPAELVISLITAGLGVVQLFTGYGLFRGKSWSYRLGLSVPVILIIIDVGLLAIYASAPPSLGVSVANHITPAVFSLAWLGVFWNYLRKPHVKEFLNVGQQVQESSTPPQPPPA